MNYDDKTFLNILKAIFYQFFSRKMQFVVFNGDPNLCDTLLFCNVDSETMLVYDENPEYFFHKVRITDTKFVEDFYSRYNFLKTHSAVIRVVDFLSTISKCTNLNDGILSLDVDQVSMSYKTSDKLGKHIDEGVKVIGVTIPEIEVDMYYNVWKSGIITSEDNYKTEISKDDVPDDDMKVAVVQDIAHPKDNFPAQTALVILKPGFTIPTLNAFCKSVKENDKLTLIAGYDVNCVILNYEYTSSLLTSIGTHPAQRWYVKNKRV